MSSKFLEVRGFKTAKRCFDKEECGDDAVERGDDNTTTSRGKNS